VGTITVLFTPAHLRVRRTIRFFGPLGISLGKRHCSLDRHGVDEWIAARAPNFAENEERPIGLDLDADFRIFNVGAPQAAMSLESSKVVSPRALTAPIKGSETKPARIDFVACDNSTSNSTLGTRTLWLTCMVFFYPAMVKECWATVSMRAAS
jgi:hypothetical protein